ncbi:carbohydrate ABC transporter permease [Herbiconiux sp. YIM B11900]|uniref:carbohydrate ABC transporter permease n=1 Tax=Herbiconiux sp. YIM B11900 TaxID=3404131 RepID=UPI003F82678D
MTAAPVSRRDRRAGRRSLVVAIPVALLAAVPLAWALLASLRPANDIFSSLSPLSWRLVFPETLTLDNYTSVLSGSFPLALMNSIIVALFSVVFGLLVASMAAFAVAVLHFPGRRIVFAVVVVSFLIPFEAIAIPLSQSFRDWGLADSYPGLILPAIGNGLAIFLLRQFFLGIPVELSEAARLDGLSWFGVLRRIYLPLSKAPLVGAGLIIFVFQWQSFLWPLLIAPTPDRAVAPVAIADFAGQDQVDFGAMFAATILTVIIPLILVLIFQRQFTDPMSSTGGKE